ncbi:hypothetical protein HDU76_006741 [Blyttiomyces sp. JEL0837]|nr:hypothetical protein HDU76_006741 [Blyttiomyces sp. JEL0837]
MEEQTVKASDEARKYLADHASHILPELCYSEDLIVQENASKEQIGHMKINVSEGKFKGEPCYFVTVKFESKWNATGASFSSTLTAYVGQHLETLTESVQEISKDSQGTDEYLLDVIREEENKLVVSESSTTKGEKSVLFSQESARGRFHLRKMHVHMEHPTSSTSTLPFLDEEKGPIVEIIITTEGMEGLDKGPGKGSLAGFLESQFAASFSNLVRQNQEEPAVVEVVETLKYSLLFRLKGRCLAIQSALNDWSAIHDPRLNDGEETAELQEMVFGDNIELESEYQQRREEVKNSHAEYIREHPELKDIMADYLQLVLHRKPTDVFSFTSQSWMTRTSS